MSEAKEECKHEAPTIYPIEKGVIISYCEVYNSSESDSCFRFRIKSY